MRKTLLACLVFFGCLANINGSVLPENDMYIGVDVKSLSVIDEVRFNAILDEAEQVYKPLFAKRGARLVIERKWTDGTVNAYASQEGKSWKVAMFGGLARHNLITPDGFTSVVCHEIGHHLGGSPKGNWAANEGQSDYYATAKCMRRILNLRKNLVEVNDVTGDNAIANDKCHEVFKDERDIQVCFQSAVAGKALAAVLGSLGGSHPLFSTPNKTVVFRTVDSHPEAQCRLDTYLAGATCDRPYDEDFSDRDVKIGACLDVGKRPRCWYAPPR